jgi:hypothetical protein
MPPPSVLEIRGALPEKEMTKRSVLINHPSPGHASLPSGFQETIRNSCGIEAQCFAFSNSFFGFIKLRGILVELPSN